MTMKRSACLIILAQLLISCDSKDTADQNDHPQPTTVNLENAHIYEDPTQPEDPTMMTFWGLEPGEKVHEAFTLPVETPTREITRRFEVGFQAGISYRYDQKETCELVAKKVEAIAKIIPFRVTFADSAGLKLRFTRQITATEVAEVEALFPEEEAMQAGLDGYISNWRGEGPLLTPVVEENLLHLWWD